MSQLLSAFLLGLVSACSLPLGALTARFYKPGDRTIAFLMSFGGGALLAALTIDLAGPALEKGHFYPLACGCIIGGLLFVILNQVVNNHGGFLRKASTTIFYLRGQRRRRHKQFIERMGRLDILHCLSAHDLQELADAATSQEFEAGMTLFRSGDPARYLYVVEEGAVELLDGEADTQSKVLQRNDAFGHMALLTGSPHATSAIAREDSIILMVPREALAHVLRSSAELRNALAEFLHSQHVRQYLSDVQQMPAERASESIHSAVVEVHSHGELPPTAELGGSEQFSHIVNKIHRVDFFAGLPSNEVHEIASRVYRKQYDRGYTFFYRGEQADRMFIIESGEVGLLDADDTHRSAIRLKEQEAFGAMSFITGTRHAMTAVAASDTSVWVLLRVDFDQLLNQCAGLARAIQQFLQRTDIETYLHNKHDFDPDMAASWVNRAVRSMDLGKLIPHASTLRATLGPQHAAPLAIWLGILLDGIPESLVIGASTLHHNVSLSLIAGLFLSNYPEALSSSVGMRQQGIGFSRILWMWTALMLITGIGAALGNLFFREAPDVVFSFVQGIAVGAMLTMIAETMLPEAYFKGGSVVGFSTLLGFLAAIFFKSIG
jgi:CRP-like cAMP-binding protein